MSVAQKQMQSLHHHSLIKLGEVLSLRCIEAQLGLLLIPC